MNDEVFNDVAYAFGFFIAGLAIKEALESYEYTYDLSTSIGWAIPARLFVLILVAACFCINVKLGYDNTNTSSNRKSAVVDFLFFLFNCILLFIISKEANLRDTDPRRFLSLLDFFIFYEIFWYSVNRGNNPSTHSLRTTRAITNAITLIASIAIYYSIFSTTKKHYLSEALSYVGVTFFSVISLLESATGKSYFKGRLKNILEGLLKRYRRAKNMSAALLGKWRRGIHISFKLLASCGFRRI